MSQTNLSQTDEIKSRLTSVSELKDIVHEIHTHSNDMMQTGRIDWGDSEAANFNPGMVTNKVPQPCFYR